MRKKHICLLREDVSQIKLLLQNEYVLSCKIAKYFNVANSTIATIKNETHWKTIKPAKELTLDIKLFRKW